MTSSTVTVDGVNLGYSPNEALQPGDTFEFGGTLYRVVCLRRKSRWSETQYDRAELTGSTTVIVEAVLPC